MIAPARAPGDVEGRGLLDGPAKAGLAYDVIEVEADVRARMP